jgi:uncharacterized protein YukE
MPTPLELRDAAKRLRHSGHSLDTVLDRSRPMLTPDVWRGAASERARDELETLRAVLHGVAAAVLATSASLEREAVALEALAPAVGGGAQ